jgi:hypothetical protein
MTTLREAAQQALEALHEIAWCNDSRWQTDRAETVIPALRAALAQEEQEPVAWRDPVTDDIVSVAHRATWETDYGLGGKGRAATYIEPLYTAPPRREWKGLSDTEVLSIHQSLCNTVGSDYRTVARAIEQALKEKNHE